jgi:hypothetical protein
LALPDAPVAITIRRNMLHWLIGPNGATIAAWAMAGAAITAAGAAIASAIIYFRTLRSVNRQTAIAAEQFEIASRQFAEQYRPHLQVSVAWVHGLTKDHEPGLRVAVTNWGRAIRRGPESSSIDDSV